MTLQALLVSTDDSAAQVLGQVLPAFGIALDRSSNPETAIARIEQQKFDALLLDFEDAGTAYSVFEAARYLGSGQPPLTVALVADKARIRDILSGGAHFVLRKPLSEKAARAGLRAVAALLSRERRRAFRVPVQLPVELTLADLRKIEGILLDLSETGMEVLTAEPRLREDLLGFRFQLPEGALQIEGHGQVAWANPNGQTGVHFLDLPEDVSGVLKNWVHAAAMTASAGPDETVPHCKLTDLSLGGCYVETEAPFPERSLIDLGLKTEEMEVHTEGMVRVSHPGHGMGVEFPSRTPEQRAQVENLISFLRSCPETMLELDVSPRALVADLSQFEHDEIPHAETGEDMEDLLLDLLRSGTTLQQDEFLAELRRQRTSEDLASV
jgi:CheY-like chemotaxis protein/c-di-GMP-binding flagellar brake protein YcgR